jgi:hypothetical protein
MKSSGRVFWLSLGAGVGILAALLYFGQSKPVFAANDRFEDYIICTGTVAINPKALTDGVWLLDYRSGKLLGTVIDRNEGKIKGWAEVDLTAEFGIAPRQNVHFMMTTGTITHGQSALYVAETTTGKIGIYTMGPRNEANPALGFAGMTWSCFASRPRRIDRSHSVAEFVRIRNWGGDRILTNSATCCTV